MSDGHSSTRFGSPRTRFWQPSLAALGATLGIPGLAHMGFSDEVLILPAGDSTKDLLGIASAPPCQHLYESVLQQDSTGCSQHRTGSDTGDRLAEGHRRAARASSALDQTSRNRRIRLHPPCCLAIVPSGPIRPATHPSAGGITSACCCRRDPNWLVGVRFRVARRSRSAFR